MLTNDELLQDYTPKENIHLCSRHEARWMKSIMQ